MSTNCYVPYLAACPDLGKDAHDSDVHITLIGRRREEVWRMDNIVELVGFLSAIACGLVAGIFFAFSAFVMKALGKLPPEQGIAAMQSINVVVLNPWFLTLFVGTAAACVFMLILSFLRWHDPRAWYWLAGSVLYLGGSILVTSLRNVPRNNELAVVLPASPDAARFWAAYLSEWTAWNHARMIASLAAAVSFTIALRLS